MNNQPFTIRAVAQLAISLLLVYGAVYLLRPFILPIFTAVILALVSRPLYRRLRRRRHSETSASLLSVLAVVLIVLIPTGLISVALIREISNISATISGGGFSFSHLNDELSKAAGKLGLGTSVHIDAKSYLLSILGGVASRSTAILGGVFGVLGDTVLSLFGLFYLLHSSDRMRQYMHKLSPLQTSDTDLLMDRAQQVIQATVRGNVILVALQGGCFVIGCLIFHFKAPLILGILYGLASMVPVIGTSVVWGPMLLFSLATGHKLAGVGIALWALVQIAAIDHILGPRLIGARTKLNPFLALLGIIGGISAFGLLGFALGPTIIALSVVGLEMLGRTWQQDQAPERNS